MARARRSAGAVLLVAVLARAARAETPTDAVPPLDKAAVADDAAKAKFAAALKLYNASQPEQALALFRELVGVTGSPNARLYVGLCLEQLGRSVDAYHELTRTAKEASLRPESKYDRTREAALLELGALEARVGKLVVTLPEVPPGYAVAIDGRALDEREVGVPVVLAPGTHRVEATAPGRLPAVRETRVDGGETRTMTLGFAGSEVARTGSDRPSGTPLARIAGYGLAGVAVAGFSMFAIGGLAARSKYGSLEDRCGGSRCTDPNVQSDIDSGKAFQTVANVGLAMGLVGGTLGTALLFASSKSDAPTVAAEPRRGGGYVHYRLRF
jgi:hypothetical protein